MQKTEMLLIDSIRDAIICYREERNRRGDSDRQVALNLQISQPHLCRIIQGHGTTIQFRTIEKILPLIETYMDKETKEYCRSGGVGEWSVSSSLNTKDDLVAAQLANWIQFKAMPKDRDKLLSLAERFGFQPDEN